MQYKSHRLPGWLLVFLLFIAGNAGAENLSGAETVILGADEWPPFVSASLPEQGVLMQVVREAFSAHEIRISIRWTPWNRAYHDVRNGRADLSPGWTSTDKRRQEVLFSDPIYNTYHVFFHKRSLDFDWNNFSQLDNYLIGAVLGYNYGPEFQAAEASGLIQVSRVDNEEQVFHILAHHRVELLAQNIWTGYDSAAQFLNEKQFSQITHHPRKLSPPKPAYLIFPRTGKGERLRDLFNQSLKDMKSSGRIEALLKKHAPEGLDDIVP